MPHWNPLDWNVGYLLQAIEDVLPGGRTWDVFVRTLVYVGHRGVALARDRLPGRLLRVAPRAAAGAALLLVLLVLPFWISYLMRMFAWTNLLDDRRLRGARAATRSRSTGCCARSACSTATTGSAGSRSR